jgi:hypothetical protein
MQGAATPVRYVFLEISICHPPMMLHISHAYVALISYSADGEIAHCFFILPGMAVF